MSFDTNDNRDLITLKKRRLFELQKRAATYGINAPPEVSIEIQDLEKEIRQLEKDAARAAVISPSDSDTATEQDAQWAPTIMQKRKLITGLLKCQSIADRNNREATIRQLRPAIRNRIRDDARSDIHVLNIIDACLEVKGGLGELIEVVRLFDGDSAPVQELNALLAREFPDLAQS
jgi:hypothetical protein